MKIRSLATVAAAASLFAMPIAAQAGTAAASAVPAVSYGSQATPSVKKKNKGVTEVLLGTGALAAVVVGIVIVADKS